MLLNLSGLDIKPPHKQLISYKIHSYQWEKYVTCNSPHRQPPHRHSAIQEKDAHVMKCTNIPSRNSLKYIILKFISQNHPSSTVIDFHVFNKLLTNTIHMIHIVITHHNKNH